MAFYFFYQSHMVLRGTHELFFTLYYICILLWYIQKLFILCFVFIPLLLFSYARKSMQHKSLKNVRDIKNIQHSTVFFSFIKVAIVWTQSCMHTHINFRFCISDSDKLRFLIVVVLRWNSFWLFQFIFPSLI